MWCEPVRLAAGAEGLPALAHMYWYFTWWDDDGTVEHVHDVLRSRHRPIILRRDVKRGLRHIHQSQGWHPRLRWLQRACSACRDAASLYDQRMLDEQHHPRLYMAFFWLLVALLVVESVLFLWSAAMDVNGYAREQVFSALLRCLIVALNVGALAHMLHDRYGHSPGSASRAATLRRQRQGRTIQPTRQVPPNNNRTQDRGPWHHPLVLLGQAAAAPMLFIPIWIELKSPDTDLHDGTWLTLATLLFLFAITLLVSALIGGHVSFGWVALGALLPVLGFVQFAYLTFYKPAHEHPNVDLTAKLEKVNNSNGVTRLRGIVTLKNNGTARAEVLGAMYTVTDHKTESAEGMEVQEVSRRLDNAEPNRRHFGKFASLLSVDDLLPTGESLAPGETRSHSFVLDARDGNEEFVRLTAYVLMFNASGDSKHMRCKKGPKPPNVCVRTEFSPASWARKLLGDEPFVKTVVRFDAMEKSPPEPPYLYAVYGSAKGGKRDEVESVDPLVRDQFTQSITEFRLDP